MVLRIGDELLLLAVAGLSVVRFGAVVIAEFTSVLNAYNSVPCRSG